MSDQQVVTKGIVIPFPSPHETPVRVESSEDAKNCDFVTGMICSRGNVPLGGNTLAEARAFVFHSEPTQDQLKEPPAGAVVYSPPNPPGNEFFFDHEEGHEEIPDVRCKEGSYRDDNWLVVWAKLVAKREGQKIRTEWEWKNIVPVRGVYASQTECEAGQGK